LKIILLRREFTPVARDEIQVVHETWLACWRTSTGRLHSSGKRVRSIAVGVNANGDRAYANAKRAHSFVMGVHANVERVQANATGTHSNVNRVHFFVVRVRSNGKRAYSFGVGAHDFARF